jgi:hypothetical protein
LSGYSRKRVKLAINGGTRRSKWLQLNLILLIQPEDTSGVEDVSYEKFDIK